MKKFIGYCPLTGKAGLLITGIVFLLITHHSSLITVSASEPATASASLLDKLNTLKKEVASKAATIKLDINKKLTNKIIMGQIETLGDNKISVKTKNGVKAVSVNEYTSYQNNVNSKKGVRKNQITFKDLSEGDYIFALGDIDDKQILFAKKIIKADSPKKDDTQTIWGKVISSSLSNIVLRTKEGSQAVVAVGSDTTFRKENTEIQPGDISAGSFLIAVGDKNQDILNARFVYLIPGGSILKLGKEKAATRSATPSASAKAKSL